MYVIINLKKEVGLYNYQNKNYKTESQVVDCQFNKIGASLEKGKEFFDNWIETDFDERQKKLILSEIENLKKSFSSEGQPSESDSCVPFSKPLLNTFYQAAKKALTQGLGEEAMHLFFVLSHLLPNNYDVFVGLGMAYQLCKEHLKATLSYQHAISIHPQAFLAYLYCAESYLELKNIEKFKENIQEACQLIPLEKVVFQRHADYLIEKFKVI